MTEEEREEQQMQQAGKIIADLSDQMDAANAATDAAFSEKIKAAASMVGDVALNIPLSMGEAAKGIGGDYLDSIKGVADYGDRFGLKEPSEEEMESMRRFSLNASKVDQLAAPVGKTGFHMGAAAPICTANAVVRCSFGATFGQLKVLPINRYCMGPMNAPVATITDFAPIINMPSFMLCFNILNPAVALETALATAAKGGVFTLVPMPCASTMVSTPWKPGHPTMVCGGRPVLTQTCSSSCWGIGTINIIHCGQGLMPNSYNWFMGPDWLSTIKGNAELLANAVGSIGALAGMVSKGGKLAQIVANNKVLQGVQKYGVDALEFVGNATASVTSFIGGNAGDGFASMEDAFMSLLSIGMNAKKGRGPQVNTNRHARNYDSAQHRVDSAETNLANRNTQHTAALDHADQARSNKAVKDREVTTAREGQTEANRNLATARGEQSQAKTNVDNAKTEQKQAGKNVSDAKEKQAKADKDVTAAKEKQEKADKDVADAQTKQSEADAKLNQAKGHQKAKEQDVKAKEENQKKAGEDLDRTKAERDKVYSDPKSTPDQKKAADAAVADAEKAKFHADIDLGTARHEKLKADNGVEFAQSRKTEADNALTNAQTNKRRADVDVETAEWGKAMADQNVTNAQSRKVLADHEVNTAQANKADADSKVADAKKKKNEADANVRTKQNAAKDAQDEVVRADREVDRTQRQVNAAEQRLTSAQQAADETFEAGRRDVVDATTNPPKKDKNIIDGYGRDLALKIEENYAQDAAGSYFEPDWGKYVDYSKEKDDD